MRGWVAVLLCLCLSVGAGAQVEGINQQAGGGLPGSRGETYEGFLGDFRRAASGLTDQDLGRILSKYASLIMPGRDTIALMNALQGQSTTYFPLQRLKGESDYAATVHKLVTSSALNQRILAYAILASAADPSCDDLLLAAMKNDPDKGARQWSGLALLYLGDPHTSDLFDFLVANEDFGDPHLIGFYLKLNRDSLRRTAFEKLASDQPKARILAIQSLAVTGPDPGTEQVVKNAVQTWESPIRGYAIYTLKSLRVPGVKDLLQPSLTDPRLRGIALEALANSPSSEDQAYLASLVPASGAIPEDVLEAYFSSSSTEAVRTWLRLVREHPVPDKYWFSGTDQPLLSSDELVSEVRATLRQTKNLPILKALPYALRGRTDPESVALLIGLLSHSDSDVRFRAATELKGVHSAELAQVLPALLRDPKRRSQELTQLILDNRVQGLHDVYEALAASDTDKARGWNWDKVRYLSVFPRPEDRELFRRILRSSKDDFALKRSAAYGLGQLHDTASVDLIVQAIKAEPPNDFNALTYLVALGNIRGDAARRVLESYRDSQVEQVRRLVAKLLQDWSP